MGERATWAKQYRTDAENARAVAEVTTGEFRKDFMQLADEYERMAREIEAENDQSRDRGGPRPAQMTEAPV
jgi:hypothetical protein